MRMKCLSQELNAMTSVRARTQIAWSSSMLKGTVLLSEFRKVGGGEEVKECNFLLLCTVFCCTYSLSVVMNIGTGERER